MNQEPEAFLRGDYWDQRRSFIYYRYVEIILREAAANARSLIDVGTGNCPYIEEWDWIPRRFSLDPNAPYRSANVQGIKADLMDATVRRRFDVCTCLQVLEHIPDVEPFARRLLEMAQLLVVSVPFEWPAGSTRGHVHDPVSYDKLTRWMGRRANYAQIVTEPLVYTPKGRRLIAIYHRDPRKKIERRRP